MSEPTSRQSRLLETIRCKPFDPDATPAARLLRFMAGHAELEKDKSLLYDPTTVWVLGKIIFWSLRPDGEALRSASERRLASRVGFDTSRERTAKCLHVLARFGIIRVVAEWDGTCRRYKTSAIEIHPAIEPGLSGRTGCTDNTLRTFCAAFGPVGTRRALVSDRKLQGFEHDCVYGMPEKDMPARPAERPSEGPGTPDPADAPRPTPNALAGPRIDSKAMAAEQKRRDAFEWQKKGRAFVESCGKVWAIGQAKYRGGDGTMPAWCRDRKDLPKAAQQQYSELVKVLETQGGMRAAVGWYFYIGSVHVTDEKGRFKFLPDQPFAQYATTDKQPATYAKYFDSLMADDQVRSAMKEPEIISQLTEYFGAEIINSAPRAGKLPTVRLPGQGVAP